MKDFKKGNKFSRDSRPGGFSRPGASRGPVETHTATCSKCHAACEVPFRPNGKKPVFCKNCFVRDDARPTSGSYEKRSYGSERPTAPARPVEDPRIGAILAELSTVHAKLDQLMARLESPAAPVKKTAAKKAAVAK